MKIGIVAPSAKVPKTEFDLGVQQIRDAGFEVRVHPQVRRADRFFAGTDEERAHAFFEMACDPEYPIVWSARGGYGAARILPHLERLARRRKVPQGKLFLGYSDATALHEFVRQRWGWFTLHSPMPGMRRFCAQTELEWWALTTWIRGTGLEAPDGLWGRKGLKFLNGGKGSLKSPKKAVQAELVGGNLTVLVSLLGTPYAPDFRGKIVFLEDVDEAVYRIDRMTQQLLQAGAFDGAKAIVLGNFQNCNDIVGKVLAVRPPGAEDLGERIRLLTSPKPEELQPLRPKMDGTRALQMIFAELGRELGIPVAWGLPVGHGPGIAPLPLGARYRLDPSGRLQLTEWDWLK